MFQAPSLQSVPERLLCPLCAAAIPDIDPVALGEAISRLETELSEIADSVGRIPHREVRRQLRRVTRALETFRGELSKLVDDSDDVDPDNLW
jgi:hypothetical protein